MKRSTEAVKKKYKGVMELRSLVKLLVTASDAQKEVLPEEPSTSNLTARKKTDGVPSKEKNKMEIAKTTDGPRKPMRPILFKPGPKNYGNSGISQQV